MNRKLLISLLSFTTCFSMLATVGMSVVQLNEKINNRLVKMIPMASTLSAETQAILSEHLKGVIADKSTLGTAKEALSQVTLDNLQDKDGKPLFDDVKKDKIKKELTSFLNTIKSERRSTSSATSELQQNKMSENHDSIMLKLENIERILEQLLQKYQYKQYVRPMPAHFQALPASKEEVVVLDGQQNRDAMKTVEEVASSAANQTDSSNPQANNGSTRSDAEEETATATP